MVDGRVKTPASQGSRGILHIRGMRTHGCGCASTGSSRIDMVVVNLYAFEKTAAKPGAALVNIENRHRGRSMVVRSQKLRGRGDCRRSDYAELAKSLRVTLARGTRWRLARAAFAVTAALRRGIAPRWRVSRHPPRTASHAVLRPGGCRRPLRDRSSETVCFAYGENPHQEGALYVDGSGRGVARQKTVAGQGAELQQHCRSGRLLELVGEFDAPRTPRRHHQHTTLAARRPARPLSRPTRRALEADPVSAFGSVIGINRVVDAEAARDRKLFLRRSLRVIPRPRRLHASPRRRTALLEIARALRRGKAGAGVEQVSGGF